MVFLDCGLFNVEEWSDFEFVLYAVSCSNIEDAHTEKAPGCLVSCCQAWPVRKCYPANVPRIFTREAPHKSYNRGPGRSSRCAAQAKPELKPAALVNQYAPAGYCAKPKLKRAPLVFPIQQAGYCGKPRLTRAPLVFPIEKAGDCSGYC